MKPRQPVSSSRWFVVVSTLLIPNSSMRIAKEGANSGRHSLADEETQSVCDASQPGRRFYNFNTNGIDTMYFTEIMKSK